MALTSSSGSTPAQTAEPIIDTAKRDPSSLVHTATSTGARVRTEWSLSASTTSSPPSTP